MKFFQSWEFHFVRKFITLATVWSPERIDVLFYNDITLKTLIYKIFLLGFIVLLWFCFYVLFWYGMVMDDMYCWGCVSIGFIFWWLVDWNPISSYIHTLYNISIMSRYNENLFIAFLLDHWGLTNVMNYSIVYQTFIFFTLHFVSFVHSDA